MEERGIAADDGERSGEPREGLGGERREGEREQDDDQAAARHHLMVDGILRL